MWIKILADFLTIQTRNNQIIGYKFRVAVFNIANTKICSKYSKIEKLEFNCPFLLRSQINWYFFTKRKKKSFWRVAYFFKFLLKIKNLKFNLCIYKNFNHISFYCSKPRVFKIKIKCNLNKQFVEVCPRNFIISKCWYIWISLDHL